MKRGFTLVELLVAVLIIGVLTAMALPMYQKSVDKSRYATLMPLAKNIKDAQEAFYLGGGKYSKDLGSLDVRVPGNPSGNTATLSDGTTVEISNTDGTGYVKMGKENLNNYYVMYQDRSSSYPGEIHCEALSTNDRANELCQNLGGTKIDNALTSGYTAYVLVGTGENAGGGGTLPVTKQIVSTEACTQFASYSNCTKYVYDDGTYAEEYVVAGSIYDHRRQLYDENGATKGWINLYSDGSLSSVDYDYWQEDGLGSGTNQGLSLNADGNIRELRLKGDFVTPSGETSDRVSYLLYSSGNTIEVSYGDSMDDSTNPETYWVYTDGGWSARAYHNSGTISWNSTDGFVNNGATESDYEAVRSAWESAGYLGDIDAVRAQGQAWADSIVSNYCAADPEASICQ